MCMLFVRTPLQRKCSTEVHAAVKHALLTSLCACCLSIPVDGRCSSHVALEVALQMQLQCFLVLPFWLRCCAQAAAHQLRHM